MTKPVKPDPGRPSAGGDNAAQRKINAYYKKPAQRNLSTKQVQTRNARRTRRAGGGG